MGNKHFDRNSLKFGAIAGRKDEIPFDNVRVPLDRRPAALPAELMDTVRRTAADIVAAKRCGASRILTFGTDFIRNGLGPLAGEFISHGWLTHLATTGTSVVDDWEFASRGAAAENGKDGLADGTFGMWDETSRYLSLAVLTGAWKGLGMGEAVSDAICSGKITVPEADAVEASLSDFKDPGKISAAASLLEKIREYDIPAGEIALEFPGKEYSLMYMCAMVGIPFTVHPMFGLDVPFMHPMCSFAATGRAAETDFLYFVESVKHLDGGVYLSVGSSVASPMIFEKALSMSQNVLQQDGGAPMTHHKIVVVDLAPSKWDWMHDGEPPETRPEYYLRYCKSFSRAKAESMHYVCADNREFMLNLYHELDSIDK